MEINNKLEISIFYHEKYGWSLIPVNKNKTPVIKEWKKYQYERASIEQIKEWFSTDDNYPAVVTGSISKIAVVDFDLDKITKQYSNAAIDLMKELPGTCISISGSGGQHHFYKLTKPLSSQNRLLAGVDLKAEGGYIILPPAIHESGNAYEWDIAPFDEELAEFPYELFSDLISSNGKKHHFENKDIAFIPKGNRNKELTSIAGTFFKNIGYKPELCKSALLGINEKYCIPPLPDGEVLLIADSVGKYHEIKSTYSFNPVTISELISREFPPMNWVIRGLIPKGGITVISGNPASYKTFLECIWSKDIACGNNFVSRFETSKSGILFIDEENGAELLQKRFQLIGVPQDAPIYILPLSGFILNEETVLEVINFCKKNIIEVVFIDSLIRIHDSDENSAREMAKVFRYLKELTKNGLTVICTHHNRKQGFLTNNPAQSMRGSSDILASVDCHLAVERNEKEKKLIIRQTKLRHGLEIKPFQLNLIADETSFRLEYAGELDESKTALEEAKNAVLELFKTENKELCKKDVLDLLTKSGLSIGKNTANKAMDELSKDGYLNKRRGERTKLLFTLVNNDL